MPQNTTFLVWKFFKWTKINGSQRCLCFFCMKEVFKSGTNNLWRHLTTKNSKKLDKIIFLHKNMKHCEKTRNFRGIMVSSSLRKNEKSVKIGDNMKTLKWNKSSCLEQRIGKKSPSFWVIYWKQRTICTQRIKLMITIYYFFFSSLKHLLDELQAWYLASK